MGLRDKYNFTFVGIRVIIVSVLIKSKQIILNTLHKVEQIVLFSTFTSLSLTTLLLCPL